VITGELPRDRDGFFAALDELDALGRRGDYTMDELHRRIYQLVPDIRHVVRPRHLDSKM
jgi:hypothetical protein